jgi:Arc/MetJ-type ribon-helix-helix transcriptional regulator
MARHTFNLPDWQTDGLEGIKRKTELSMSEVVRQSLNDTLSDWTEEIPEHVERESIAERIKRENKPMLREMHFKQRTWEYVRDLIFTERGQLKRFPPDPEQVEEAYFGSMERQIAEEFDGERSEDFTEHIDELRDWYQLMHPDTETGSQRDQVVHVAAHLFRWRSEKDARDAVKAAIRKGKIRDSERDGVLDDARELYHSKRWKHQWDQSARGRT